MQTERDIATDPINQFMRLHHYSLWQLLKTYWYSSNRVRIALFSLFIITLTIVIVAFDVIFTYWYNYFYNALQAYDVHSTLRLLGIFCVIATIYIILAVYRFYLSQLFGLQWRRWLTHQFIGRWLDKHGYYYLENFDIKTDNPDQRIQEDIAGLITNAIDLGLGLIAAVTTIFAFIYVLWHLSGVMHIPLGSWGTFALHGYLVWVGIAYALLGTLMIFKVGRPLIPLNFEQQHREANFRFNAMNIRTHSEDIALYRGEAHQKNILHTVFNGVLENWYAIIVRQRLVIAWTSGYGQIAVLLPLAIALPNYFGKVFLLGGLIQSLSAFRSLQDSLSFLVNAYPQIAQWKATGNRLTTFINHLDDVEEKAKAADHLKLSKENNNHIVAKHVTIQTPQGHTLLKNINEELVHGKHYLIKGHSGIGKSTFVRTLAGIWPYVAGSVILPAKQSVMFLPQQPYMPIGTLAEAILFPDHTAPQTINLEQLLKECNLAQFIPRLNEQAAWAEQLSPGEQQRVAFARVLAHKPDWVFLDESTSMLDLANEKQLYTVLKSHLPHCSIVSVGHRPSLENLHDEILDMTKYA